ncbi:hypothetical protein PR003_g25810 [Phytophthora rubi]|uniref:Uncharacterized protein n=1 Tax=Phytophthora rubi TaxID=129364 RepID=A0A6A3IFW0_9STRA|nr:hypothetical protein PR002_g24884 [Phytophthora rubi]KAE8979328.1 hypothetical protein PR001_g24585 [Phytophthora rubi]KAE9288417.1 hypothetical protein PR003_g25810 [Phytophthora rubi]
MKYLSNFHQIHIFCHEYQEHYGKKDEDCDEHGHDDDYGKGYDDYGYGYGGWYPIYGNNDFNVYGKYGNDFGYGYGGGYYGYDPSVYNYAYAHGLGQPYRL